MPRVWQRSLSSRPRIGEDAGVSLPTIADLTSLPAAEHPELVAAPTAALLATWPEAASVAVVEIDPDLADTAALVAAYDLSPSDGGNCVVVGGQRAGDERIAACVVAADTRADVNGLVRKLLDVRKASFLPMDRAVEESGMEYGGITPVGLPASWRLLIDARLLAVDAVVLGSGVRHSKLLVPGAALAKLPGAEVVEDLGR
jgi:prolyl-tRNA editing enzyme YbaK/EbsC (Cys-tRNA(Pro) deacylase)